MSSLKTYTINVAGKDNGNDIPAGFTIDILAVAHYSEEEGDPFTKVSTCTKNANGVCGNDDILASEMFSLQSMASSTNAVLNATIEDRLDTVYG